jgi:GDPmannose 4,6-dehydratase
MPAKRALITGISGQDGSYLAELLLDKGYEVHGTVLRSDLEAPEIRLSNLSGVLARVHLHAADLESYPAIVRTIEAARPDECYHLAARSFVAFSFEDEFATMNTNINGTHHVLAALRTITPECRFFFAGSSEMFGKVAHSPQSEATHFHPRSAYGISKETAFELMRNYREAYGFYGACGILYNHESPRRGYEFVTRKITSTVARIRKGLSDELKLGRTDSRRDWGYAPEYVEAMWLMLQQPDPDDYVIATGKTHTVQEFAELAFSIAGLKASDYLRTDEALIRPSDELPLTGDAAKARRVLGWAPRATFEDIVREMVAADLK